MVPPLFGRSWSVAITRPNVGQGLSFSSSPPKGEPLRMAFAVERTLHSEANKAKIQLTNLGVAHRNEIGPGSTVVLRAGYGQLVDIIFRGTVAKVTHDSAGTDVTTDIEAGDGEPYLTSGHVHLAYRSTTSLARVIQDICDRLQLTVAGQLYRYEGHVVQRVPRVTLPRRVISGPVKQVLDNLLHPLGISWSIQCGSLLIQGSQGIVSLQSQVLSAKTGLLGIPSKTPTGLTCRTLLLPTIAPGLPITIDSKQKDLCGDFRVVSAKYAGDSYGPDWFIEVDAQGLKNPLADYVRGSSQADFEAAQVPAEGSMAEFDPEETP